MTVTDRTWHSVQAKELQLANAYEPVEAESALQWWQMFCTFIGDVTHTQHPIRVIYLCPWTFLLCCCVALFSYSARPLFLLAFSHSVWPRHRKKCSLPWQQRPIKSVILSFKGWEEVGKKVERKGDSGRNGGGGGGFSVTHTHKHTHKHTPCLSHTNTECSASVGSSHGKMFSGRCGSHGRSNQLGTGDLIQIVVSQVRASVGTKRSKRKSKQLHHHFPLSFPTHCQCRSKISSSTVQGCCGFKLIYRREKKRTFSLENPVNRCQRRQK